MSDKARLLQESDDAFLDLRQAIDGLDDGRLTRVWLGTWSIREILIHITGWHQEMLPALARVARGEAAYPAGTYDDFDAWNARFVEAKAGVKVADVLAQLDASHRDFVRAAGAVPDAQLAAARDLVEGTGAGHYREHAAQIRAWRQKEST
jgi:hypothetical protein